MVRPFTACCCWGVVTVMTLNPDCESRDSFWAETLPELLPVVSHAVINVNAATTVTISVSIDSFFIYFVYNVVTNRPGPPCPWAQIHRIAALRYGSVPRSRAWGRETVLVLAAGRVDHRLMQQLDPAGLLHLRRCR